jgi:hypothetical protein
VLWTISFESIYWYDEIKGINVLFIIGINVQRTICKIDYNYEWIVMHGRILYVQGFLEFYTCHQLFVEYSLNKIIWRKVVWRCEVKY